MPNPPSIFMCTLCQVCSSRSNNITLTHGTFDHSVNHELLERRSVELAPIMEKKSLIQQFRYIICHHPKCCTIAHLILQLLDAVDGQAARALGQISRFGAVLDMVTDGHYIDMYSSDIKNFNLKELHKKASSFNRSRIHYLHELNLNDQKITSEAN
ncbi:uncharacterized protein MELLADRAFT_88371 [Melampsora larici-populina 98AG31]|uniref:Uncharacterized protein n=1 Tax=Melampsora larici-populina (strain 98AG31 / pathotype 3-4-7) TaxID=747676 RepID=F4RRH1_MELLP|nr:uncharacterized protein MELLADRAFT_88371 [Melampsora larici-populina 98AG31]EGG05032.1 hypothetical protein MELLADRAFT_88371 [Melampsora larici-populina 98AG31]